MNSSSVRIVLASLICILALASSALALTVTTTPRMVNVSPGTNSPIQLLYSGTEAPAVSPANYAAISTYGWFETQSGTLLGAIQKSVTINMVNRRGTAQEVLVVPAKVMAAAMKANQTRIVFFRSFSPQADIAADETDTLLQITPSSIAEFGIIGLRLEFNQPAPGDAPRPPSGGRITVPRNTKGLRAAATITYNGQGLLRGRWVVDGQVQGFVTKQLIGGMREAIIASPAFPAFPTFATGLHSVRFEILNPAPGLETPSLLYFVTGEDIVSPSTELALSSPENRAHLPLSGADRPVFTWQAAPGKAVYLFRIFALEPEAMAVPLTDVDFSKPVLSARTAQTSFTLSPFDTGKLAVNAPYAWQVQAFEGEKMIAASAYRIVLFSGAATDLELKVPLRDQGVSGK
jgi:hypothetical protein